MQRDEFINVRHEYKRKTDMTVIPSLTAFLHDDLGNSYVRAYDGRNPKSRCSRWDISPCDLIPSG